jgi:quinol monooxygenase YgiN
MGCSDSKTTDQSKPQVANDATNDSKPVVANDNNANVAHDHKAEEHTTDDEVCVFMTVKPMNGDVRDPDVLRLINDICQHGRTEEGNLMHIGLVSEDDGTVGMAEMFKNMDCLKKCMGGDGMKALIDQLKTVCDESTMTRHVMMCCVKGDAKPYKCNPDVDAENPEMLVLIQLTPNDDECKQKILNSGAHLLNCSRAEQGCLCFQMATVHDSQNVGILALFNNHAAFTEHENSEHIVQGMPNMKAMVSNMEVCHMKRLC